MELSKAILTRRSIRSFLPGKVSQEDIKEILTAAMHAPSARNTRPWDFIVVQDGETIKKINKIMNMRQVETADTVIITVGIPQRQAGLCEGNTNSDCAAATENLILRAWDLDISSVWCGIQAVPDKVKAFRALFGLPEDVIPFCAVALGKQGEDPECKGFYDESLVHWEKW